MQKTLIFLREMIPSKFSEAIFHFLPRITKFRFYYGCKSVYILQIFYGYQLHRYFLLAKAVITSIKLGQRVSKWHEFL